MLLKDKQIFIVEDNLQNRVIFQMALVRHGASVEFERWGRYVLSRMQSSSQDFNLIILDLMLADGVSGFDIFDTIRSIPKYATIPIVAVSAMDPAIAIPKVRLKGFSGFIAKPIDSYLFPKQLASIMDGEQVWHAGDRNIV